MIEKKVSASSLSAAAAGVVLWALQTWAFKGTVPAGVVSLVYLAVPAISALVAGYLAPHTPRPAPAPNIPATPPTPARDPGGTA